MSNINDLDGRGVPQLTIEPDPAVGVGLISFVVPPNKRWFALNCSFTLNPDGTGSNRNVIMSYKDDLGNEISRIFFFQQDLNTTVQYGLNKNGFTDFTSQAQSIAVRFPDEVLLAGYEVELFVQNIRSGDQISNFRTYGIFRDEPIP